MLSRKLAKNASKNLWNAYSTQTSPMVVSGSSLPQKPHGINKVENGAIVLTIEPYAPISAITCTFRSGLRYENARNAGVSQKLKICSGLKTKEHSAFMNKRRTQQIGAELTCEVGRETMTYGVSGVIRNDLNTWFSHVSNISSQPLFRRWELEENIPRIGLVNHLDSMEQAVDFMHTGAFHSRGLGNQALIPDYNTGEITDSELQNFWKETHSLDRLVVVGYGMEHEELSNLVRAMHSDAHGNVAETTTQYFGGEVRKETDGPYAFVAVGGPGVSLSSTKELDALSVAQGILGTGKQVKYGDGGSNRLIQALVKAGCSGTAACFQYNYSDTGVFGFTLVETAEKAGDAVKAAAKAVRSLKVTEEDLKIGKINAQARFLQKLEKKGSFMEYSSRNLLFAGNVRTPDQYISDLNNVTADDVQKALSKVTSGKACMGAYGGISRVPYLDEF